MTREQMNEEAKRILINIIEDKEFAYGGIPDETDLLDIGFTSRQAGTIEYALYREFKKILDKINK